MIFIPILILLFLSGTGFYWLFDGLVDASIEQLFYFLADNSFSIMHTGLSFIPFDFMDGFSFKGMWERIPQEALIAINYLKIPEALQIIMGAFMTRVILDKLKWIIPFY